MGDYPRSNSSIKRLKEKADIADFILKPLDEDDDGPTPSMKVKKAIRSRRRATRNRTAVDLSDPRNCFVKPSGSLIPIPISELKPKNAFPKDPEAESLLGEKRVSIISSFETVKWNFDKGEPEAEVEPPPWMEPFSCDGMFEARYDLLPMELILIIFKQITVSDRMAAGETCRRWMEASYYYEPFLNQTYYHFDRSDCGDQVAPFKYFSEGFRYYPRLVFTQVDFNKHSDFWFNHGLGITELTLRSCKIRKKKFLSIMRNLLNLRKLELMQCDELFKNWNIEYNHQEPMFPFFMFCLKHLSLSGCDYFNEYHFERFITMAPNLSSIDVSNCFINLYLSKRITMLDRVMKLINRNRYLMKSLNLADTPCVDDFIWHCLCELESLQLTHFTIAYSDRVPLKDPGILRFFGLQTDLTYLNLTSSIGLSDECLQKIITSCPRLHTLLIRRCWLISDEGVGATTLTKEGVEIVRRPMHTLEHLRVLDISNCERISDFSIQTYIIGKRPREMNELQLCMLNNLSESSIYYIAVTFKNIQVLNLDSSANAITDNSLQYIMCYLTELRDLNIVACTKVSPARSRPFIIAMITLKTNKQTKHYTIYDSITSTSRSRNLARSQPVRRDASSSSFACDLGESN